MFQYGSDEFGQDSPRYTSPKAAALYADPYYIGESRFHKVQFASHSSRRNYWVGNRDYEGNRVIITMTEREKERRTKIVASPFAARFSRGRKCRPPPTVELGSETRPLLKVNGGKFLLEPIDPNVATDPVLIAGLFASLLFSPRACTRLYLVEIAYVTISNER